MSRWTLVSLLRSSPRLTMSTRRLSQGFERRSEARKRLTRRRRFGDRCGKAAANAAQALGRRPDPRDARGIRAIVARSKRPDRRRNDRHISSIARDGVYRGLGAPSTWREGG